MAYGYRRYYGYGPGYGYGRGYGLGYGYRRGFGAGFGGRRWISPNCDFFPDRPRGWWAMPEYQGVVDNPPSSAQWDPYGKPSNVDAIDYEISLIEKQIDYLQKEISLLEEEKQKLNK